LRDHRRRRVAFVVAGDGPWGVGGLVHGQHASKVYGGSLLWGETASARALARITAKPSYCWPAGAAGVM
jgi:hypothetical protein